MKKLRNYLRVWYIRRYYRPSNPLHSDTFRFSLALILIFALWTWASNEDYKEEMIQQQILKESYLNTLTTCINGDCRFQWGSEIFELRGGSLGSSEVNVRTKDKS